MPEIGATLREARMRARIDISEIEAETKIRAKYLRALENEEWGLLPGPAYVRSFLRTYAEALDLDAKLLLEEYKLRHERPSDHDLMPIGAQRRRGRSGRGGGPVRHREPRGLPRGLVIGVIVLLLIGALYLLGTGGKSNNGGGSAGATGTQTSTTTSTPVPASQAAKKTTTTKKAKRTSSPASSRLVRLQLLTTGPGPVSACLVDAAGRARIPGATLQQNQTVGPYRSKSFRLRLGNGNARIRVNGKTYSVAKASPVAYRITKGSVHRVNPSATPSCGP